MKIIYIYILKKFINTFFFSLLALSIIFIIVDLFENLDKFLDRNAGLQNIALYYLYYIPSIIKLLIPIGTLVSALFSIGNLSNQNEIIAMKSGSMSLYKLMLPLIILTIFISAFQLWFVAYQVPKANKEKNILAYKYLGQGNETSYLTNLYLRETPTRNVLIREFNSDKQIGFDLQVNDFTNDKSPRLKDRYSAKSFKWDSIGKCWDATNVTKKSFNFTKMKEEVLPDLKFKFDFNNKELSELVKPTEEMNIKEWYKFIMFNKSGGQNVELQLTDFYGVIAFPFANTIVILFAVPFASVKKRGGLAVQIGAALTISFVYLIFTKLGQTLGFGLGFQPILSAWLANILFFISGIILILKTPK